MQLLSFLCRPGIQRPATFALVGTIGVIVQLGTLEALTALGCHYLWATGLAVEAAVLHNFMWHQRFTWRDRSGSRLAETGVRLLRLHLSNGDILTRVSRRQCLCFHRSGNKTRFLGIYILY
jgi:putative flippase GtrA